MECLEWKSARIKCEALWTFLSNPSIPFTWDKLTFFETKKPFTKVYLCDYTHVGFASCFEALYWPKRTYYYFGHGPVKSPLSGKVSYRCFYYGKLPFSVSSRFNSLYGSLWTRRALDHLSSFRVDNSLLHERGYQYYWKGVKTGHYDYLETEDGHFITFSDLDEFKTLYPDRFNAYIVFDSFYNFMDSEYAIKSSEPFPGVTFSL